MTVHTVAPAPFVELPYLPLWRGDRGVTLAQWEAWALAYGEAYADRAAILDARAGLLPALTRAARSARVARGAEQALRLAHDTARRDGWALPTE
jgi:hypothetical protein